MTDNYEIRAMARADVDLAVEWAAREGWNPGLHDAACFYAADAGGFLLGLLGGEPVAAISAVRYGETFGFLGLYLVKPQYRGRNYGLSIWKAAMDRLQGRNIGLDGVVEQQANYRKSGFRYAHRNIRYEGVGGRGESPGGAEGDVVDLSAVPFSELCDYDRPFFPAARAQFLESWIGQPGGVGLGVRAGGRLAGYGVIRRCRVGHKIGPLFADTPALAQTLFSALAARAQSGAPVYLDIPGANPYAAELAQHQRMKAVFETARMYTGPFPELPMEKMFGVTTFELG